jgi:N-acyl-D-aspartate/D-glutamate deacylase
LHYHGRHEIDESLGLNREKNMCISPRLRFTILFLAIAILPGQRAEAEPIEVDILLKGGTIHDGSGGEPAVGDVAIRDGRIVAVGTFEVAVADQVIPCEGLVIAPGFIDLHNHSDSLIVLDGTRANMNYVLQGCTTIVTGNCGSGPINVKEYYERINSAGAGTNVVHLLPQGNLRREVVGTARRSATRDEIVRMRELAEKAMQDGAWGMSTGLIYVPSSYASTDELVAIARMVSEKGGIYASHIRGEGSGLLDSINEAIEIGRRARLPVHVSHFKSSGRDNWGLVRVAVDLINKARENGQVVTADQYPYRASSTSLDATLLPSRMRAGGRAAMVKRLDDSKTGPEMIKAIRIALEKRDDGAAVRIARYNPRKDWVGKSMAQIAEEEKKSPLEIALQIIRGGGAAIVNFSMDEDDVRFVMRVPWVATASDGRAYLPGPDKPHPRSYGTFPRKLGYYAIKQGNLPLAQAVRSASGLPADILGMKDRGYIRVDQVADVTVFDPLELIDVASFDDPHQYSLGVRYVLVNGRLAVYRGTATGALAGRALKKK